MSASSPDIDDPVPSSKSSGLTEPRVREEREAPKLVLKGLERPPRDHGRLIAFGAMGTLVVVGVGLLCWSSSRPSPVVTPPAVALTSAEIPAAVLPVAAAASASAPAASATAPEATRVRPPPAWRVSSLKVDANMDVVEGTFGKRGFVQSLTEAGIPRPEIKRLARAFDGVHRATHPTATDSFVVARDKTKNQVVAFELATSPLDVWQARGEEPARKLELFVEHKRVASSIVVSNDLAKAIAAANLRPEIVDAVDDALDGHVDTAAIRSGARMRVAATEDWVEGAFVRVHVDALEFVPKSGNPLRVYYYERDADTEGSPRRAPAPGYYDAKGKQPYRGAFRSPLALARVTSRFNPKRMHPVLHVLMPHNGVDFAASTGTPVYSAAVGTVTTAGNGGPCGNMVEIDHAGGVTTAYCHLSRFAQGLHPGQKVEARQLIGYAGQTGRVTGPHLHFVVKRGGVYIDPLALKLDGVRVLPPADRDAFARKHTELDSILDGVALPSAADIPDEPDDKEPDEKDFHEE